MKRNDRCVQKAINSQLKINSEYANQIFLTFKKLYFDMKVNELNNQNEENEKVAFNNLNKKIFHRLINISLCRFKKIKIENDSLELPLEIEENPIDINKELKAFLKSCGNTLNESDIEFMIHLIENFDEFEKNGKSINYRILYDIWGALIHFSSMKPEKIIEYVFYRYSDEKKDVDAIHKGELKNLTMDRLTLFLDFYHDYFSEEQTNYLVEECKLSFGKEFSLDAFTHMLLSLRKYHPY